ncbi:MAG: DUF4389 domain-containing protein [Mariprofundus sp.]|nr:DUF4389 domain-containing protein [Mariprofundus sp.]
MNDDLKTNVTNMNVWLRLVFMLLFSAIYFVTRMVLVAVIVLQFLWLLFTADKNKALLSFGAQLATFIYQIYHYLTFNTEQRPFPFSEWPADTALIESEQLDDEDSTAVETESVKTAAMETGAVDAASENSVELTDKDKS